MDFEENPEHHIVLAVLDLEAAGGAASNPGLRRLCIMFACVLSELVGLVPSLEAQGIDSASDVANGVHNIPGMPSNN